MSAIQELLQTGLAHQQAGRLHKAEALYREVLALRPNNPHALHLLGVISHQVGNNVTAVELISRAIEVRADVPDYYANLGMALRDLGRLGKAEKAHREALHLKPDYPEALNNLGISLNDQGRPEEAETTLRKALALQPGFADAHNSLGISLRDQDRQKEAEAAYREALRLRPVYAEAYNNLGLALRAQQKYSESIQALREAIRLAPGYAAAYFHLSLFDNPGVLTDDDALRVEELLQDPGLSRGDASYLHFVMGKILDEQGDCAKAFAHYRQGNESHDASEEFNLEAHVAHVDNIITTFDEDFFARHRGQGSASESPVFIVGLSRSGKTLVERVLAAHPHVHGAGELLTMPNIVVRGLSSRNTGEGTERLGFPQSAETLEIGDVLVLAEQYLARLLRDANGEVTRLCDTLPSNLFRLGLIAVLFPHARIIHCRREPMDMCLAIYFKAYRQANLYAYELETICGYYREYARLMDHWRQVLPIQMCEINYEEMVSAPQDSAERLVEFLGLEWDQHCLEALGDDPLHERWIGHSRRYEEFLKPFSEGLSMLPGG